MATAARRRKWPYVLGGLLLVLGVALGVALWRLDAFLLAEARKRADAMGVKLGRKISIGGISTTLLTGLGVRVDGVEVGPAQGEELPLRTAQAQLAVLPEYADREELGLLATELSATFNDERLEVLRAGEELEADAIITATGLRIEVAGGITFTLDGATFAPNERR